MNVKLAKVYCRPRAHWKGIAAIKILSEAAKVAINTDLADLSNHVARISSTKIRCFHTQRDAPSGPSCSAAQQTATRALTVVNVASRYEKAEPMTSKNSDEVGLAFQKIYKR